MISAPIILNRVQELLPWNINFPLFELSRPHSCLFTSFDAANLYKRAWPCSRLN